MKDWWQSPKRYYLVAAKPALSRINELLGAESLHLVQESGGKVLFCNQPIDLAE